MSITDFLNRLPAAAQAKAMEDLDCTIQLNASAPTYVRIAGGRCTVHPGSAETADVSLTTSDENLVALLTGKLSGVMAFMSGKLKIDGDLVLAKDLPGIFDASKLV